MESKPALLILIVGVIHSTLCYTPSKVDSLTNIFSVKHKNPSVREAKGTEQIFLPSPITVLQIQRKDLGDKFKFTVKYNSTQTPVVVEWNYALGTPGREVGNGVYETNALASSPNDLDGCTLYLYTPDYRESILVWLKFGEDAVENNIPELPLYVEPTGDFVYDEEEDFVFKGRFPETLEDLDGYYRFVTSEVTFVNLDTGEAILDGTDGGQFDILDLNKDVFVRPSTQTGPFPAGYLGFVQDLRPYGEDILCTVGEHCTAKCIAAGEGITEIRAERLPADEGAHPLSNPVYLIPLASYKTPYIQEEKIGFQVDSMPDRPEKIRCTAKNSAGREISKETTIQFFE